MQPTSSSPNYNNQSMQPDPIISKNSRIFGGCVLAIAIQLLWFLSSALIVRSVPTHWETLFLLSRGTFWLCVLFIWLYAFRIERIPFLPWPEKRLPLIDYTRSLLFLIVTTMAGVIIIVWILTLLGFAAPSKKVKYITQLPLAVKLFSILTAAVAEELIYRGYLQPRLQLYFKSDWPPILISSFFFGLLHAGYGTLVNMIGPLFIGIVYCWHYRKYQNITVLMLAHLLYDAIPIFYSRP